MRTVLITGASSGIGRATTILLAKRGWWVFATMRDLQKRALLDQVLEQQGIKERVEVRELDLTSTASIRAASKAMFQATGNRIDAVIHNAGVAVVGAFEELPEMEVRRVMETNFFGVLELTRAVLPQIRQHQGARIVIVSSEVALNGHPANSVYSASKWAIEGWAESVAYEFEQFGIQISLVEPGPCRTGMWATTPRILPYGSSYGGWLQQVFRAGDLHAVRHAVYPSEVAEVIAETLESRRARFRNPVGSFAYLSYLMRGKIPTYLLRRLTKLYLGLPQRPSAPVAIQHDRTSANTPQLSKEP